MNRRQVLTGMAVLPLLALGLPRRAMAMGGTLPAPGTTAPDFDLEGVAPLPSGDVAPTRLARKDFLGRWLVLYFYPKDFTTGCTLEARGFQRDLDAFHALGAEVVGVSADDTEAHVSFCGSEGLTYPLLSDPGGRVSLRYGSWIPPFSQRHSFLIDPEGVLRERWVAVRPAGHSREVLETLQQRQSGGTR
jgi:peroxiredoxin Q/BCP